MLLPAVGIGFLVGWLTGATHEYFPAMIAGFLLVPIDIFYRAVYGDKEVGFFRRWFALDNGGWVAFPVWFLGLGFILLYFLPAGYIESL